MPQTIDLSPEAIAKRGLQRTLLLLLEPPILTTVDPSDAVRALLDPRVIALVPGLNLTELAKRGEPPVSRSWLSQRANPHRGCLRSSLVRIMYMMLSAIEDERAGRLVPGKYSGRPRLPPDPAAAAEARERMAVERRTKKAEDKRQERARKAGAAKRLTKAAPGDNSN